MIVDIITTPFGYQYPDTGGQGGPSAESGTEVPETVAPTDDGQGGVPSSFYEYEDPSDKKKYSFPDKDSLTQHVIGRGMTQATFTKKSQEHANNVKAHEAERLKFENDRKSFHSQYESAQKVIEREKQINAFLTANPGAAKKISEFVDPDWRTKSDLEKLVDEKYGKKIEALEGKLSEKDQKEQERELLAELSRYDEELKSEAGLEDYDPAMVEEAFEKLKAGTAKDLKRMLYYAAKGQTDPVELQKRMAENAEKKKRAGLVSGTGKAPSGPSPKTFTEVRRKHTQQE